MPQYISLVTLEGQAKIAAAMAGGASIVISHLAVGDGNGQPINPVETATGLVHEVWRANVDSAGRDPVTPNQVIVQATIPVGAGPFSVREVGLYTDDGRLFALASYPETYKPTANEGAVSDIVVEFVVVVDTTAQVVVTVNALTQINVGQFLRAPFMCVNATLTAPPASPAAGDTYIVGVGPTGAWAGLSGKLAQWNGSLWSAADVPVGHLVVNFGVAEDHDSRWLRRTSGGWISARALDNALGLIELATDAEAEAGTDGQRAITAKSLRAGLLKALDGLPFFPEITTNLGIAAFASSTGSILLSPTVEWLWRLVRKIKATDFTEANRTFATVANKTYHLQWYAPGTGKATPLASYPNGRLVLEDLADNTYSGGNADHSSEFDSTYDRMILARVVTSAGNVPTITALKNMHKLEARSNFSSDKTNVYTVQFTFPVTLNWARNPSAMIAGQGAPGGSYDSDYYILPQYSGSLGRYSSVVYLWSWPHETGTYTSRPSANIEWRA